MRTAARGLLIGVTTGILLGLVIRYAWNPNQLDSGKASAGRWISSCGFTFGVLGFVCGLLTAVVRRVKALLRQPRT